MRRTAIGLWDPGSTLSFITFDLAAELGLQGQPVQLEIVTVGGVLTKVNSKRYHMSSFDDIGCEVKVEVLGIEQISTEASFVDKEPMRNLSANENAGKKLTVQALARWIYSLGLIVQPTIQ